MTNKVRLLKLTSTLLVVFLLTGVVSPTRPALGDTVKIDPELEQLLLDDPMGSLSVIIQGQSAEMVTDQVIARGGKVLRNLSIIRSVVAQLSVPAILDLAGEESIKRVWLDRGVTVAGENPEAGAVLWTVTANASVQDTPTVGTDGVLYMVDKAQTAYAFNSMGEPLWTWNATGSFISGPVLGPNDTVILGTTSGTIYALDSAGQLIWEYESNQSLAGKVDVAENGTVVFSTQNALNVLNATGQLIASYPLEWTFTGLELDDNGLVAYVGDRSGSLYAFDLNNGLQWVSPISNRSIAYSPVVAPDGTIFCISRNELIAVSPVGEVSWRFLADRSIGAAPVMGKDGTLYFGDIEGTLYALKRDGELLWSQSIGKSIRTSVAVAGEGTLFVADKDVLAARATNGSVLFEIATDGQIKADPVLGVGDRIVYVSDSHGQVMAIATGISLEESPDTAYPRVAGAENVWAEGYTGAGVGVAIIDTGIAPLDELKYNAMENYRLIGWTDMLEGSSEPIDPNGHGTHVAGIVANSSTTEYGHFGGVAPNVNLIGVRVMDASGCGTYADVIAGIDWVVNNKDLYNIQVINLSIVAPPQSHYWDDPLNQAVMAAWAADIVVVAAAGNSGPAPMTITVPGNVPYIITVGAFTDNYTPDDFSDDYLAPFSAAGPTWDGFVKPDVIAPGAHMISLMSNESSLALNYPERQVSDHYYQWAGTSTAAPVVSGICAMILEANPDLTPDQVKYRLLSSARIAVQDSDGDDVMDSLAVTPWQQGAGHVWASDAVLSDSTLAANQNMNITLDLAGVEHYIGPTLYHEETNSFYVEADGEFVWNGSEYVWSGGEYVWSGGEYVWSGSEYVWNGSEYVWNGSEYVWNGGEYVWNGGEYVWSGSEYVWNGGEYVWNGSEYVWSGGEYVWSGGEYVWSGSEYVWSGGEYVWSGSEYVWNGSEYVWNGSEYVWNGGEYVWNGGEYVWSGGLEQVSVSLGLWLGN